MSLAPNWNEADDFVIVYNFAKGRDYHVLFSSPLDVSLT